MNYKELEQEVKRLEEQIKDLKVKLEEKAEKKAYEVEVPEDIEDYYALDGYGKVCSLEGFSMNYTRCQYERGLAFKTRKYYYLNFISGQKNITKVGHPTGVILMKKNVL